MDFESDRGKTLRVGGSRTLLWRLFSPLGDGAVNLDRRPRARFQLLNIAGQFYALSYWLQNVNIRGMYLPPDAGG
jgi:hypothetical protein